MSEEKIHKAETSEGSVKRPPNLSKEKGQPQIVTSSRYIQNQKKKDLRQPAASCTYDNMMLDEAVYQSVFTTNALTISSISKGEYKAPKGASSLSLIHI